MGLITLSVVSIIIFSSMELLPGDFGQAVLGQAATEETVAAFRRELGLDQSAVMRYGQWISAALQGDLGTSFSGRNASGVDRSREVIDLVVPRLRNTLFLASVAALIAVPLAFLLGITTALFRNSIYDRSVNIGTLTTISFPEFFVAYILILFLSSLYPVFPSLANVDSDTQFSERFMPVEVQSPPNIGVRTSKCLSRSQRRNITLERTIHALTLQAPQRRARLANDVTNMSAVVVNDLPERAFLNWVALNIHWRGPTPLKIRFKYRANIITATRAEPVTSRSPGVSGSFKI